jgi:hypothetical protein
MDVLLLIGLAAVILILPLIVAVRLAYALPPTTLDHVPSWLGVPVEAEESDAA